MSGSEIGPAWELDASRFTIVGVGAGVGKTGFGARFGRGSGPIT